MTRSTLWKKMAPNPSSSRNRRSERKLMRALRYRGVRTKHVKQKKITLPPLTLRRSERTSNVSSSSSMVPSCSKQEPNELENEDMEELGVETSSQVEIKRRMNARIYRTIFKNQNRDCHEESNNMDKSTPEGGNSGGAKIDECFKVVHLECKEPSKDGIQSEDDKAKEVRAESKLSEPVKELLENNNITLGSSLPSNATAHETDGVTERVQSDCCREETLQSVSRNSILNENLIRSCVAHDKGEKLISSKRKGAMLDMHSDVSATLVNNDNCNLIADASPSRLCGSTMGSNQSCSKRIRPISLLDVQRNQRKWINNVDQPSSKYEVEKLSIGKKEGKSGDPVERPQSNNDELRKQQRSLHLLLKPEIAKLCKTLRLPDNVKRMVENILEYIMNNRQICTEPVSILQAFQLSLCWTAAALLKHKLDHKDSLMLAKRHLNFNCKIEEVNAIHGMMWKLKEDLLYHAVNYNVSGSPKASESSNTVYSNIGVAPKVELAYKDISKSIKEGNLLLMQLEEKKKKLTADIEKEKADFDRRYKIEWAAIRSCSPNDAMRTEKLKVFNSEYDKRIGELKRQHETRLKDIEAKQLEARRKLQESWPPHALINLDASRKLGTGVEYLQPHNGLVSDLGDRKSLGNIGEAMTRTGTRVGLSEAPEINSPVVLSCSSPVELQTPLVKHAGANEIDIMSSEDQPVSRNKCHDIAENEYDGRGNIIPKHSNYREQCSSGAMCMADEVEGHEKFSRESRSGCEQDTVTSVPLSSNRDICDGETSGAPSGEVPLAVRKSSSSNDQDEVPTSRQGKLDGTMLSNPVCGCSVEIKLNRFSDGCEQDTVTSVPLSSNKEICNGETLGVPSGEVALAMRKSSGSNDEDEVPTTRQAKLDGTMLSNPVCGGSVEIKLNRFSDGVKNMASLISQSPEEHIPSATTTISLPVCENASQIHEANDSNGSNNADTLNPPLSASLNLKSPQENIHSVNAKCMPNCENSAQIYGADDDSGSNNSNVATTLNPPLTDDRIADRAIVSLVDGEVHVGMPDTVSFTHCPENVTDMNLPLSMEQISGGAVNVSVSDRDLSRPCAASPSNGPDGNSLTLSNQLSLEKQHPDEVALSIPAGQVPVEVQETAHEGAAVNVLDREAPVGMPSTVNCPNHALNVSHLNSSSTGQISDGDSLIDGVLQSRPSSPSNGPGTVSILNSPCLQQEIPDRISFSIPDGQIPVIVPETSHKVAECQLTDSVVVDKSTTSDPQEGVHRIMTENTSSQEIAGSRPVDRMEPLEQVQPLSSVLSSPERHTARETPNSLVSSQVDIIPTNQSNHVSLVMEPPEQMQQISSAELLSSNQNLSTLPSVQSSPERDTAREVLNSSVSSQVDIVPTNQSNHVSLVTEPPEQVQQISLAELLSSNQNLSSLSSVQSSPERDTAREVLNSLVSSQVDTVPTNQSNHVSLVMELPEQPPEQVQQISSAELLSSNQNLSTLPSLQSSPERDIATEMLNSSVSSQVDIVPTNRSKHVSLVTEPPEQVQQLPSAEFLSSNQNLSNLPLATGIEHQSTNEHASSSPIPETSIEVPNQAVEQPASNFDLDSTMPGGVRTQPSDRRNLSTPSEINNYPIQTATQSAYSIVPPLCNDSLINEWERMRKLAEQNMRNHEDAKLQLKSDFEREFEELRRQYEFKFQENEVEFQQTMKNLDTHRNIVRLNKILAEAFRSKSMNLRVSDAPGMQQDASTAQQLFQLSRQQNATWPSPASGPSSCGPPAASLHSSYSTTSSQNMAPPLQATYNTSGIFSSVSPRLPTVNSISSPSGNLQAGGEMRAPAPHLRPYRPSTSVPAPTLGTTLPGMPSHPAPGNIPVTSPTFSIPPGMLGQPAPGNISVTSPTFSYRLPQPMPAAYQPDPRIHRGHQPVNVGVLPTPNLPARDSHMDANSQYGINLQNVLPRMSNMASLNLSTSSSMPANPAHQGTAPDVVCLSDDE